MLCWEEMKKSAKSAAVVRGAMLYIAELYLVTTNHNELIIRRWMHSSYYVWSVNQWNFTRRICVDLLLVFFFLYYFFFQLSALMRTAVRILLRSKSAWQHWFIQAVLKATVHFPCPTEVVSHYHTLNHRGWKGSLGIKLSRSEI